MKSSCIARELITFGWWAIINDTSHSMETCAAHLVVSTSSFYLELAWGIWLWRAESGEEEEVSFCVVGPLQFIRFDLWVLVVELNKIMFEFHKWLQERKLVCSLSELWGFTEEIHCYSTNIKQPEQKNKLKNTTTYYLQQQTMVNKKPQQ